MTMVPEFTVEEAFLLLSQWVGRELDTLQAQQRYVTHYKLFRGAQPWGWPLVPVRGGRFNDSPVGTITHLYFARDCTGAVKVGISGKPDARMREIGGNCQLILVILECCKAHETALHRLLSPDHTMGEWFQGDLTESLIKFLLAAAGEKASAA